ncbi:MAG: hypothetical protein QM704_24600 [Anaeromyxobacteraceae bacterium]
MTTSPAAADAARRLARPRQAFSRSLHAASKAARAQAPPAGPGRDPGNVAPEGLSPAKEAASLRAAVRILPVAVTAALRAQTPGLSLDLGRALSVELRPAPGAAVELVLRPAPALARVAAAELPALVKALRDRGVRVARAAVRAR